MKFLCSVFVPTILMPQHNKRWQRLRYIHIYRLRKKVLVDEGVISDLNNRAILISSIFLTIGTYTECFKK